MKPPMDHVDNGLDRAFHPIGVFCGRLPPYLSRWLGLYEQAPTPEPTYATYLWPLLGSFCGLATIQAIFGHSNHFTNKDVPPIIPSLGASAVLCYGVIASPLAQPRSLIGGHFLSALTGVIVSKVFSAPSHADTHWAAASLATAVAIVVMQATRTTHPPAGATALLPIVDARVSKLGWYFLPVMLLSSTVVLVTAMLFNNVQRRFPAYWWTPRKATAGEGLVVVQDRGKDVEKGEGGRVGSGGSFGVSNDMLSSGHYQVNADGGRRTSH